MQIILFDHYKTKEIVVQSLLVGTESLTDLTVTPFGGLKDCNEEQHGSWRT